MSIKSSKKILCTLFIVVFTVISMTSVVSADDSVKSLPIKSDESLYGDIVNDSNYNYEEAIKQDQLNQEIIDSKPIYEVKENGELKKIDNGMSRIEAKVAAALKKANGTYPRGKNSKGTILYTTDTVHKVAKVVGHAAIVYDNNAKNSKVIEATSKGVIKGNNTWDSKKHCRAAVVTSLSTAKRAKAADKCASWLGKPYNWNFSDVKTRKKFYCSHLVWAGYMDTSSVNLDDNHNDPTQKNFLTVYPSELIASKKTSVTYKKG